MSEPLSPGLEQKAQELAARIRSRSEDSTSWRWPVGWSPRPTTRCSMIAVREAFARPALRGSATVRDEVLGYSRNQLHRMDDPTYEANGGYIGSGAVGSAGKTVVGRRMKGAGMRGSEPGAHAVCHTRALYRSGPSQWTASWQRSLVA